MTMSKFDNIVSKSAHVNTVYAADIVDVDFLNHLVDGGWVERKSHKVFPYDIYCYSRQTEFMNKWDNDTILQARGLIIDRTTGELIARPFDKFFNLGTYDKVEDFDADTKVQAYDKLDGCFAICYLSPDGVPFWTSKGSFNSDESFHMNKFAKRNLGDWVPEVNETVMCEYVGENSRIVLNYDNENLILLGSRNMSTGIETTPENINWNGDKAEKQPYNTIGEAVTHWNDRINVEGQVITIAEGKNKGHKLKLKTDEYFFLHRQASRVSYKNVYKHLFDIDKRVILDDSVLIDFISSLPDEFQDEAKNMAKEYKDFVNNDVNSIFNLFDSLPSEWKTFSDKELFQTLAKNGFDKKDAGNLISVKNGKTAKFQTQSWLRARKEVGKD